MTAQYPILALIHTKTAIHHAVVNGLSIEYLKAGHGPPLILLHGANIGWIQWYNIIASLAQSYTVYAPDWPGSGHSTPIDFSTLTVSHHFEQTFTEWIDELHLNTFCIIAHSVSGPVAVSYAQKNPKKVRKLILISSMGFTDYIPPSNYLLVFSLLARIIAKTVMKPNKTTMRSFLQSVLHTSVLLPEEFIDHYTQSVARFPKAHPLLFMQALMHGFHIKKELMVTDLLPRISCPILMLHGTHDPLIPVNKISSVIRIFPRVRMRIMEGVGHVPSLENSSEFLFLVRNFLR